MRNVVIPNLPFLPSPPLPSLSLIGCHELLDVCLVCACVRACVWQLSTSDQRGLRLCWMSGRIIKRRRLSYSAWRRWLHLWPTHTHTRRLCHFFFSLPVFFFFHSVSINLSICQPFLRHGFLTLMPLTLCPRLNTRNRGWFGESGKNEWKNVENATQVIMIERNARMCVCVR